jgi:hypothetical protein
MKYIGAAFLTLATMICALTIAIAKEGDHLGKYEWAVPYLAAVLCVFVILGLASLVKAGRQQEQKNNAPPLHPPVNVHHENKPQTHIENKPVFENKPTIIVSTGASPAPAPELQLAYNEVFAFLERTMQRGRAVPYFVEHIATATHLPEQQVFNALQRLIEEEHVFRRPIEGVGTDGGCTRWGFFYWYAHY